jgi:hypothetical protein
MKKFKYTGSMDHNATIRVDGNLVDLRLTKGQEYDLPADNPHVKVLISTGLLVDAENNIAKK